MAKHRIQKGIDLSVLGGPEQTISPAPPVSRVAVLGVDFPDLIPSLRVALGDAVKRGQPLFDAAGVVHTSPAAGTVAAVHRGEKDTFLSVVIELSAGERAGIPADTEYHRFTSFAGKPIPALSRDDVRALLLESGLWTAFRTRPFNRTPDPNEVPDAIFITGMDTEPLAPKPEVVVAERAADFDAGLAAIAKLREGKMFLCVAEGSSIKAGPYSGITVAPFSGPHPTGLAGTHIHYLFPVDRKQQRAWHIGYQDVIRIGVLVKTGKLHVEQIVSLAGPAAKSPRLIRTRLGAAIRELTVNETKSNKAHFVSGSVLSGRNITSDAIAYLGRFHRQIVCLNDARSAQTWIAPGGRPSNLLTLLPPPFGLYAKALPIARKPSALLRALIARDAVAAERLGCLELDEEDLGLCSALNPNLDYGAALRDVLNTLERASPR